MVRKKERTIGAVLTVAGSLVVTVGVWLLVASGVPINDPAVFYFPVVILATLRLGWQAAALAVVLQVLLSDFFLIDPLYYPGPRSLAELITYGVFAASGGLIIVVTERLKRALGRTKQLAEENRWLFEQERERRRLDELFVSALSHELRTPLTVIKANVQLARRRSSPPQGDVLDTVEHEIGRLTRLLESLLDFQRLQYGSVALQRAPVDLVALTTEVAARVRIIYPDHTFRLQHEVTEAWVEADVTRLEQVLTNLLTNAAKYSPGQPYVDVLVTVQDGCPVVMVRDYGVGIAPEEQDKLFTPFYRTQSAQQTGIQGTGLGLYIARQIVELHGGSLRVTSTPGAGSTFTCILPPLCKDTAALARLSPARLSEAAG